jgi:hypothetical protein
MDNSQNQAVQEKIRKFLELLEADIKQGKLNVNSDNSETSETSESSESSENSETTESKEGGGESGGSEDGGEYQQLLKYMLATNPAFEEWGPMAQTLNTVLGQIGARIPEANP